MASLRRNSSPEGGAGGARCSAACSRRSSGNHEEAAAAAVCALVSGAACGCVSSSAAGREDQPSPSHDELIARTKEGRYSFPSDVDASDAARSLVSGLMQVEPARRLTADQVLQHIWITAGVTGGANLLSGARRQASTRNSPLGAARCGVGGALRSAPPAKPYKNNSFGIFWAY